MKPSAIILLLIVFFTYSKSLAQTAKFEQLIFSKEKMPDNKNAGRSIGRFVSSSDFKIDSSGYQVFYVCQVLLNKQKSTKTYLHYLIGQKNRGEILITIDKNFNNSFLDDTAIIIKTAECTNCGFTNFENCFTLSSKYFKGASDDLTLHILPRCCFKNVTMKSDHPFLDTMNIAFESPFERVGNFSKPDSKFQITLRNLFPRTDYLDKENVKFIIKDLKNPNDSSAYGMERHRKDRARFL